MNGPRFQVGDWVRVKTLDEIKQIGVLKTYGVSECYEFRYGVSFYPQQQFFLCGNTYQVIREDDCDVELCIPGQTKTIFVSVYAVDKGKTNFDWLRSLSPERLSRFLDKSTVFYCTNEQAILRWLNRQHTIEDEKI